MIEEDFYYRIISTLENSKSILGSLLLNLLTQFPNFPKNKDFIKNCIIIILSFLNDDNNLMYEGIGINIREADNTAKRKAVSILRSEFLSN